MKRIDALSFLKEEWESLKNSLLNEGVDDPGILKCVFMAGGPGSGKSFTAMEIFGIDKKLKSSFSSFGLAGAFLAGAFLAGAFFAGASLALGFGSATGSTTLPFLSLTLR